MKPTTKRLSHWLRQNREFWTRSQGWKCVRILTTTMRSTVWNTAQGTDVPVTGGMYVPQYTQLDLSADTAKAMLQAADLGTNIQRLYQHELYFRTNGRRGERLNSVDLERLYQNMSVWLWNETKYRYEEGKEDELGFKTFTEFLNCYTNNAYVGTQCSAELKKIADR